MSPWGAVAAGHIFFYVAHIAWWRARPSNQPRMARLGALALASIAVSLALLVPAGLDGPTAFGVVGVQAALLLGYAFVYAGMARSVSVTLLGRLLPEAGAVALSRLVEEYAASSRFEDRIRLMDASGLLEVSDQAVALTDKGRRLAITAQRLTRVIGVTLEG
jgi:hypothetical protein